MRDCVYAATPPEIVEVMLDLAEVKPGEYVADLGCGDGRIAVAAAERGALAIGYDCDPAMVRAARLAAREAKTMRAIFVERDLFDVPLSSFDVVMFYLNGHVVRLLPQVRRMRPGSRVVSLDFGLGVSTHGCTMVFAEGRARHVYMWRVPLGGID